MSRKRLFIENIFAYGFINILNKIVPFLLLPVITRMLPNASDYGVYNMYTVIVGFGTPLAILGLYDAMFREYFERDDQQYKYDVTTTAQRIIMLTSVLIAVLLILFNRNFSNLFFGNYNYSNLVIVAGIGIFLSANNNPIKAPTRMNNERKIFVVSGLLSATVMYGLSLLLIYWGFSYFGLIYASIATTSAMLLFFWLRNNHFFLKGHFDINIAKELLKIGLPLVPTFLIYWIYNSMDKIMITNMLSTNQLGIYSIGSKMAQVSQLIYAGFAGGWQYFSFSTMKDDDQVELNSKVFDYLAAISTLSLIFVYPFIPYVFKILFRGDYVNGYIVAPYLYLSPLLLMLFQVIANQFLIIKKSKYITLSLLVGAVINIYLNYILINIIGIEGASIATLIGYSFTLIIVILLSLRNKLMFYSTRTVGILLLNPVYLYLQKLNAYSSSFKQFGFMMIFVIFIILLYRNEVKQILKKARRR